MLAGVEASPGDLGTTTQAGTMLGLGFAFLFAVFPLYNWIPMLMDEASPYVTGFLLWALPTFTVIFALGFLDRYVWLRTSPQLSNAIQFTGVFMVASGGIFASMQRHIGRMMGYSAIAETGLLILIMGLRSSEIVNLTFLLLIPRGLVLAVWALALSILKRNEYSLLLNEMQGLARSFPAAVTALILAQLSMAGFPLLAGFPARLAVWQELAGQSLSMTLWVFIGTRLAEPPPQPGCICDGRRGKKWGVYRSWVQVTMLQGWGDRAFHPGNVPQILQLFLADLPSLQSHWAISPLFAAML